jgi:hypothetical protein
MISCPNCGSILFIDLEGRAEVAQSEMSETAARVAAPSSVRSQFEDMLYRQLADPSEVDISLPEAAPDEFSSDAHALPEELATAAEIADPTTYDLAPPPEVSGNTPTPEASEFSFDDFDQEMQSLGSGETTPQTGTEVLHDIERFGNEISDSSQGQLYYTLVISAVDTKDLIREVWDALTDSRLGLDLEELRTRFANGRLELARLNAVKTSVLVSRLRFVDVEMSWRQYASF